MPAQSALCPFDVAPASGTQVTLIGDDFAAGTGTWQTSAGWATGPAVDPASYPVGSGEPVADAGACATGCTLESRVYDVSNATALRLDFRRYLSALEDPDELTLSVWDGSVWSAVRTWSRGVGDDGLWHDESVDLSAWAGLRNLRIRFTAFHNGATIQLDDVALVAYVSLLIPTLPPQSWLALALGLLLVTLSTRAVVLGGNPRWP